MGLSGDNQQDAGRCCVSVGHERLPAAAIGVFDDGDAAEPDVAYCAGCAQALIKQGEFTPTSVLTPMALDSVACPRCRGTGRLSSSTDQPVPDPATAAADPARIPDLIRSLDDVPPEEMTCLFFAHAYWELRQAIDALLGITGSAGRDAVPSAGPTLGVLPGADSSHRSALGADAPVDTA